MEEILDINGVKYIKKVNYDKLEDELSNIRKMAGGTIMELQKIMAPSTPAKPVIKRETKVKRKSQKDTDLFEVNKNGRNLWNIKYMDEHGRFYLSDNRVLKFKIGDVLKVQKGLYSKLTYAEARKLRKEVNLNEYVFNRLVYNYQEGVFSEFIKQWNKITQPHVGRKEVPIENNPEKRKEGGMYV